MEERFEQPLRSANETERKINYANDKITVVWKPGLCIHSTRCFIELPAVFDPRIRKWVNVNGGTPERIIAQVNRCPSGALTYIVNSEKKSE